MRIVRRLRTLLKMVICCNLLVLRRFTDLYKPGTKNTNYIVFMKTKSKYVNVNELPLFLLFLIFSIFSHKTDM